MNKRPALSVLFITWMCLITAGVSTEEPLIQPNQTMPMGERLVYKISWLRIPVAVGELWVKEKMMLGGREVIHVVGIIETNKVLKTIFPMHDEAHSWIDMKTFESVQFEKIVDEIKINAHERIVFDAEKKKGYFESIRTGEKKEFNITTPVHDLLSAIYWTRRQALEPGTSIHTVLSADQKDWALEIKVLRKETVKLHGKKVDTFRIEPNTVSDGVTRRGRAYFNIANDSSRIPIRGGYKASFGRVVGTLKEDKSS